MQKQIKKLSQLAIVLFCACIFIATLQLLLLFVVSSDFRTSLFTVPTPTEIPIEELLTLIPNSYGVLTANKYDGSITITIRGEGKIDSETLFDAFYTYSNSGGNPTSSVKLKIDNQEVLFPVFTGVLPRYNPSHEYSFLYYVGNIPKQVSFQIVSETEETNSGEFVIEISSKDKVSPRGR
jgi:hypothetical protein